MIPLAGWLDIWIGIGVAVAILVILFILAAAVTGIVQYEREKAAERRKKQAQDEKRVQDQ